MLESLQNNVFTYTRLSEADQKSRGILGRLVGVIADTVNPTRNGRHYGKQLWENVFNDPLMIEKIENRCCFGELGHPADREEVDPEKIAICLAEKPKLGKDGLVYGVFDILNTPNGKILKSLCDYGTNIGVSSRGSGDVIDDNEVDEDTYYCECWDAVVIPAVKTARMKYVTESLDPKQAKLRRALCEAYNSANEEDKKIMKETLDELDINLQDDASAENLSAIESEEPVEFESNQLVEAAKKADEEAEVEEDEVEEDEVEDEEVEDEVEEDDTAQVETIDDLIKELKEFDKKAEVEFAPLEIEGKEYQINNLTFDNESEEGKIIISIGYNSEESDNIENEDDYSEGNVDAFELPEDEPMPAEDNGDAELIESLKEMVRKNTNLDKELKALKSDKAVCDAEVEKLKESLTKYKDAFNRTSEIAATIKPLKSKIESLNEQLAQNVTTLEQKDREIKSLKESQTVSLTESTNKANRQITVLKEQLNSTKQEVEQANQKLTEQANVYKKKLSESAKVIEQCRRQANTAISEYINFRASILGVRPAEITNQLNENYSIADINEACENILSNNSMQRLPFGFNNSSKIRITESKSPARQAEDDGFDDLLELAGLKN